MAKEIYVGVNDKARKVKKAYVGIDGVAHKVLKVYVGDGNNKARLCWVSECNHPSFNVDYFWADDCEYCEATATCTECGYQEFETDYYPEFRVYEEPTCTEDGRGDYGANFSNELFESGACPDWHTIEALGHDMSGWVCDDSYHFCSNTCQRNGCSYGETFNHPLTELANTTFSIEYYDTHACLWIESWGYEGAYISSAGSPTDNWWDDGDTLVEFYEAGDCYINIGWDCPNCGASMSCQIDFEIQQAPEPEFDITWFGEVYQLNVYIPYGNCHEVEMSLTWDTSTGYVGSESLVASDGPICFPVTATQGDYVDIYWRTDGYDSSGGWCCMRNSGNTRLYF